MSADTRDSSLNIAEYMKAVIEPSVSPEGAVLNPWSRQSRSGFEDSKFENEKKTKNKNKYTSC